MASQITSLTVVYSTVHSGRDQRKHQSSASLAFVREIHRCPVNSPHKRPVTRKMFPFDVVIIVRGPGAQTASPHQKPVIQSFEFFFGALWRPHGFDTIFPSLAFVQGIQRLPENTLFTRVKIPIYAVCLLLLMLTRMSLHTQEQFNFFTVTLFNCSVRECSYCLKIWTSPRSWLHATIKQCGHQWLKMLQSSWHTGVYFHNCVKPLQIDRLVQKRRNSHYNDAIMGTMASQITSLTSVYSTVYSGANQRKHQSSASLAFVLGIHRGPVNSPHKWPVTRKMFPFDDVIMSGLAMELRLSCTYPSKWKLNSMTLFALVEKHGTEPKRLPYQEWPSIYWCK